jgi:hypothetical protein
MYEFIVSNILMDHYWKREFAIIFSQVCFESKLTLS